MNLPQLALLLDEISLQNVRYGNHVLDRINVQLTPDLHFKETWTGIDILKHFDTLPYILRNNLRNMSILSKKELEGLREDVLQIKTRLQNQAHEQDQTFKSWLEWLIWFTLFYITYKTMLYVFTLESAGEQLTGNVYGFLVKIVMAIEKFILE